MEFMKLFGVVGLLCITAGILLHDRKKQNYLFIAGGISLAAYSVYIEDSIFIILQIVFVGAAITNLLRHKRPHK